MPALDASMRGPNNAPPRPCRCSPRRAKARSASIAMAASPGSARSTNGWPRTARCHDRPAGRGGDSRQVPGARSALHDTRNALARERKARYRLSNFIGVSEVVRQVNVRARRLGADHRRNGRRQELRAQALHLASARAPGPFLAVNMAAVPEALLESGSGCVSGKTPSTPMRPTRAVLGYPCAATAAGPAKAAAAARAMAARRSISRAPRLPATAPQPAPASPRHARASGSRRRRTSSAA